MILGTSIITLSLTNYKIKRVNSEVKYGFYYAEGALEESVIILNKIISNAIKSANNKVQEEASKNNGNGHGNKHIDVNTIFSNEYTEYIANQLETQLLDINNYRYFNEDISIQVIKLYNLKYTIVVTYTDKIIKSLSHDVDISIPNYEETNNDLINISNFKIIR